MMPRQGRPASSRRFINSDELDFILYQLNLVDEQANKSALQLFCDHVEVGRVPENPEFLKNVISGLLVRKGTLVRRWAYKAIALLGKLGEKILLVDRIKMESDPENITWALAALYSVNPDQDIMDLCRQTNLDLTQALSLASLLYIPSQLVTFAHQTLPVNVENADHLALKWCALLIGYEKAPDNLLHSRAQNADVLRALTQHAHVEVSEYSVWAFWKNPNLFASDLNRKHHEMLGLPDNIRRWHNRLISKDPTYLSKEQDLFYHLYTDDSFKAREGLALGIREAQAPQLQDQVLDWYTREEDERLKALLLEHMARAKAPSGEYQDVVLTSYERAGYSTPLRQRLRGAAASAGSPLHAEMKRLDAVALLGAQSAGLLGEMAKMNSGTNIYVGAMYGGNVAARDVNVASENSVNQIRNSDPALAELLDKVLAFVKSTQDLPEASKSEIESTVREVAAAPTPANKGKLLGVMKGAGKILQIADSANGLRELITAISEAI